MGLSLQGLARLEFGGIPPARHDAYADSSPIYYVRKLAFPECGSKSSGAPATRSSLTRDTSPACSTARSRSSTRAPVTEIVGTWRHTAEMHPWGRMPIALVRLGLLHIRDIGLQDVDKGFGLFGAKRRRAHSAIV